MIVARGAVVLLLAGTAILIVLLAAPATAQEASELLASPRHETEARQVKYVEFTVERLLQEVAVVSSRSSAWFGFNTPEVQIHLPRCDNSIYADIEFSEPKLTDDGGAEVAYESERGIYDHELFLDELRFKAVDDAESSEPPQFAMAEGTVRLRYPLSVRTLSLRPDQALPADVVVRFDGPFVHWQQGGIEVPEAASFSGIEPMRAFDKDGRQLERHPNQGFKMVDNITTERYAYWGEVAELRIDVVEQWAVLEISYQLPPVPLLAQSKVGEPQALQDKVEPTAGGTVSIKVPERAVEEAASAAAGVATDGAGLEAIIAGVSPAEAKRRLQGLGYSTVDDSMFVMSAVQGDTEAVRMFLAAGLPVDTRYDDRTPLLSAAMTGQVETALLLIEAGADVNAADSNSSTSLIWSAQKCATHELVQALVDAGADVNAQAKGGATPLMMAKVMSCTENLRILTEAGVK
jgi:hypothetical protein